MVAWIVVISYFNSNDIRKDVLTAFLSYSHRRVKSSALPSVTMYIYKHLFAFCLVPCWYKNPPHVQYQIVSLTRAMEPNAKHKEGVERLKRFNVKIQNNNRGSEQNNVKHSWQKQKKVSKRTGNKRRSQGKANMNTKHKSKSDSDFVFSFSCQTSLSDL